MWKYCLFLLFPILIFGIFIGAKQISASWVVDLAPPTFTPLLPQPTCYTTTSWGTKTFTFSAADNLSGIVWIKAQVTPPGNTTTQTLTPTFPTSYNWVTTLPSTGMSDGTYDLVLTALDGAGNLSAPYIAIDNFTYKTPPGVCGTPWIQTVGGDVHSNNSISIPTPAP